MSSKFNVSRLRFERYAAADPGDRRFLIRRRTATREVRYWNDQNCTLNQGSSPSCVGHGWAHWLLCKPISQFVEPITGIYDFAKMVDEWEGTDYDGTSVRAGAKVLAAFGFIQEYRWTWEVRTLANAILTQGPVVVGTNWYEGMCYPDSDGVILPDGELLGGHCYLVTGVTLRYGYFRIRNSWDPDWGLSGRAWITFEDMHRLLQEDGECCLGVEKRPAA